MNCPKCGEVSSDKDLFCGSCGTFLNRVSTGIEPGTSSEGEKEATNTPELPMVAFGESIGRGFRNYITFSGRATRAEYWWFFLFVQAVSLASVVPIVGWIISLLGSLALIIPQISISVRRLHDIGKTGWWVLVWYGTLAAGWGFWGIGFMTKLIGAEESGKTDTEIEAIFQNWFIWAAILGLASIAIMIWWIMWFVKKGDKGTNKYGLDPREPS